MISTRKAQAAVTKLTKSVAHSSKVTDKANQRQQNSWQRLGSEMKTIAVIGAGLFAGLVAASPALQASLLMVSFEAREMARAVGDELAPIINDFVLPALVALTDAFLGLPQPIRSVIAVVIGLSVVVGILSIAMGVLAAVSWPIVIVILAIMAVISAVIWVIGLFDKKILKVDKGLIKMTETFWNFIKWIPKGFIMGMEAIWNALKWLWDKIASFGMWLGNMVYSIGTWFHSMGEKIYNFFKGMFSSIGNVFKDLANKINKWGAHMIESFVDGAKKKWEDVKGWFSNIGDDVADFLGFSQPPSKGALKDIDDWGVHAMQRLAGSYQRGIRLHLNPSILSALPAESFTPSPSGMMPQGGASSSTTSLTINIDRPTVRNDSDIDDIAERVSKKIYSEMQWNSRGVNS